jgi:hypothetical protein
VLRVNEVVELEVPLTPQGLPYPIHSAGFLIAALSTEDLVAARREFSRGNPALGAVMSELTSLSGSPRGAGWRPVPGAGVPCLMDGGDYSSTDDPVLPWGKTLRLSGNSVHHYHGAGNTLKWRDSSKRPAMLADKSHRMSATVPRELHHRNRGVIVNMDDGRDVYGYYFDR